MSVVLSSCLKFDPKPLVSSQLKPDFAPPSAGHEVTKQELFTILLHKNWSASTPQAIYTINSACAAVTVGKTAPILMPHSPPVAEAPFSRRIYPLSPQVDPC